MKLNFKSQDKLSSSIENFCPYPLDLLPAQSDCCRSSFFNFFIFYFSLHSTLDGGIWFQTVEFGSVLECDWKMRFIVPKNHPERKRTSILVEWGRKKLKLIDFLSQSLSRKLSNLECAQKSSLRKASGHIPPHSSARSNFAIKNQSTSKFFDPTQLISMSSFVLDGF